MIEDKPYKKLIAWQKADAMAHAIYKATASFPRDEMYGIVSQLRRAALSVGLNIVEGFGRIGKKEKKRFMTIALGSLMEVDYLLYFSQRQSYLNQADYEKLESLRSEAGALLWGYHRSL